MMNDDQLTLIEIGNTDPITIIRNADGSLKASDLKATQWFMVDRAMKPRAVSAPPLYYFTDQNGEDHAFNLIDIKSEYKQHQTEQRRLNRKKAQDDEESG